MMTSLRIRCGRLTALVGALLMLSSAIAAPSDENEVISPAVGAQETVPPPGGPGAGALTAVAVIMLAGAGGWVLWRGKAHGLASFSRTPRQLAIEETKSLGNRQFLVVASYQDRKYLLGVCPGRIDLLAPLSDAAVAATTEKRA